MNQYDLSDLNEATSDIALDSLYAAKKAIAVDCREYIIWTGIMSPKVEEIACPSDLKKLAKAITLTMLGHLPTKSITCPFCIQYSDDQACRGCGYALTHGGRCDEDTSAFSRFIEAFHELGKAILQDQDDCKLTWDIEQGKAMLHEFIDSSAAKARQLLEDLPETSVDRLMEMKALYLDEMICLIPIFFFSKDVEIERQIVRKELEYYW